jgi:type II secretory pathway component PulF
MATFSKISLSGNEKIELVGNLATMLSAGIPILDAVNSILEDAKGNQKKILDTLKNDLMQGKQISASLTNFPKCFDKVTVSLVKASEEAGTLEVTLKDLQTHIQKDMEFADKIKFAMIYPMLIMVVFGGVMGVILVFVVPKISQVFLRLKVNLPLPTKILIFLSDLLLKQTVYLAAGVLVLGVLFVFLYKKNRSGLMEIFYRMPLVSRLVKEIDLTRFSRSLYLLLSSGIPITSALDMAKETVFRRQTMQIIAKSRDMVMGGKKLSEGLRTGNGVIPSIVIKLVEAGEKSGSLDKAMMDVSNHLDYQVSNSLKMVTAILEPVMLVMVAVSVGGMMLAIIAPIYGLISQVGAM